MKHTFSIGEKVVALIHRPDSLCQDRIKGKTYIVLAIRYCSACGNQTINIGTSKPSINSGTVTCRCGASNLNNGLSWTRADNFAPLECKEESNENKAVNQLLKELDISIN